MSATDGLGRDCYNALARVLSQNRGNAIIICDYVTSMRHEVNLSDAYRVLVVLGLCTPIEVMIRAYCFVGYLRALAKS
jgi:hypothetical protein